MKLRSLLRTSILLAIGAAGAAAIVALAYLVFPGASARALSKLVPELTLSVPGVTGAVALTIDDGPSPRETAEILDVLRDHSAQATFFLLGESAASQPELLRRMITEGHELANHDWRDRRSARVPERRLAAELDSTDAVLSAYGPVRWFRPGSGVVTPGLLRLARERNRRIALGDVYPLDDRFRATAFHRWYVLRHARAGSILIFHDGRGRGSNTAMTLREILPALAERGLEVVTLTELERRRDRSGLSKRHD